jgi:hypothetical protein
MLVFMIMITLCKPLNVIPQSDFLLFYATPFPNKETDFLGNLCKRELDVCINFQQLVNIYFVNCRGLGGLRSETLENNIVGVRCLILVTEKPTISRACLSERNIFLITHFFYDPDWQDRTDGYLSYYVRRYGFDSFLSRFDPVT